MANHPNRGRAKYEIVVCNQGLQRLQSSDPYKIIVFARLIKSPHGWMAHRGETGDDANHINVSRLINQPDGAALIAEALGL
jgi:hypothetical protein